MLFVPLAMLIYDLSTVNKERLNERSVEITPQVLMRVNVRHRTGTDASGNPTYGTGYDTVLFDVSDRLLERPSVSLSKPRVPGDSQTPSSASMTIRLANDDGYIAVTQQGAIIRGSDLQQAIVYVLADIGTGTPVDWFVGRVVSLPTEERGSTTFHLESVSMWAAVSAPVMYEQWSNLVGVQALEATATTVTNTSVVVSSAGKSFHALHGLATFDSSGNALPWFKREGGGDINLHRVGLVDQSMRPGVYRIEFISPSIFRVIFPTGQISANGNRNANFSAGGVSINSVDWFGTAEAGSALEFRVSLTLWGNGVAMIAYLLERAMAQNYGTLPGTTPTVALDMVAFQAAADRFDGMPLHVTATNTNNDVWEFESGNRPLNCAELAQMIADHYCCTLAFDRNGEITIRMPFVDDNPLWHTTTDAHVIESIKVHAPDDSYNYLRVQYGRNAATGTYAGEKVLDLRESPTYEKSELVVSLPFIPLGHGDTHADWLAETIRQRHLIQQVGVTAVVTPQYGLPMQAGDITRIVSAEQPIVSLPCEVVQVSAGIGKPVTLKLAAILAPEGTKAQVCVATVGQVGIW